MPAVRNIQTRALMDSWWFCSFHSVSIGSSLLLKILRSFILCCVFREIIEPVCVDLTFFSLYLYDAIKASLHNNGRISRRRAINPHSSLSPPTSHHHQVRLPLYRHFSFLHSSGRTRDSSSSKKKLEKFTTRMTTSVRQRRRLAAASNSLRIYVSEKKYPALIFSIVFELARVRRLHLDSIIFLGCCFYQHAHRHDLPDSLFSVSDAERWWSSLRWTTL